MILIAVVVILIAVVVIGLGRATTFDTTICLMPLFQGANHATIARHWPSSSWLHCVPSLALLLEADQPLGK